MQLIDYQVEGSNFLIKHKRCILADEMGLGKTVEAIDALKRLDKPRILIICPGSALYVWQYELSVWAPNIVPTMVTGHYSIRADLWQSNIVLVTLDIFRLDINKIRKDWDIIIIDETHKIKNRKTLGFKAARKLRSKYLWLLTGTPASRGSQDMWTYLNLINPKLFRSYWKFVNSFCEVVDGFYGKEIVGTCNAAELRELLKTYMLRRTKEGRAPLKTRQKVLLDIDPKIQKIYYNLTDEMVTELESGGAIVTPTVLAKLIALQQLLVCPKLLDSSLGYGSGIATVLDIIKDYNDHFVIITPFSKALEHFETYLRSKGYNNIVTLKGGMKPKEVATAVSEFKAHSGIALMSLKFAQSFSLETAVHGYFLGFDWDPINNLQAEDRINRMNSVGTATLHYLVHKDSIEETLINPTLNMKTQAVNAFMLNPKTLKNLLVRP